MIKKILFAIFLFASIYSTAQDFKGGLYIGAAGCQIEGDSYKGYKKGGAILGAYANSPITENSSWQIEIRYIGKGAQEALSFTPDSNYRELDYNAIYKVVLHYIEVPLLLKVKLNRKLDLDLGVAGGFLFGQSINDLDGFGLIYPNQPFRKYEISGLIGFSFWWTENIGTRVNFQNSLVPIQLHPTYISYWDKGKFNRLISISLFYQFD